MEESLSRTSSGILVSNYGIPHDKLVYWNIHMVKMEESLSRTSSCIQVSIHGIAQDKMVYWNIPYGEDGRESVQDLLWYPDEHPWYTT